MRRLNMIALIILFATIGVRESMAQPTSMSYQGQLLSNGAPFDGQAQFKFAIYDVDENLIIWSNDGTGIGGGLSEPASFVTVPVTQGVFGVRLGAPPMVPLTAPPAPTKMTSSLVNFPRCVASPWPIAVISGPFCPVI